MKEVLITSSVLIVVILLVRGLFRGKVSQKLIYAAWLLVALRLLIPVQFGQFRYSVTTLAEKAEAQSRPIQQVQQTLQEPVAGPSRAELYNQLLGDYLQENPVPEAPENPNTPSNSVTVSPDVQQAIEAQVEELTAPTLGEVLTAVWIVGICGMAAWFITANLLFLQKAKKDAADAEFDGIWVRISPNVPTPCVVGLFRPVIYLTPACAENDQSRTHVLAHERAHLRHGDHIWALVRCLCLCIYWFDPLVWVAAAQSRRDCELACDESALKELGDAQRIAYGKTLLDTVSRSISPVHLLETATAMNETKRQLAERVRFIAKKPRNILVAAFCLVLVATITAGCAFLGASPTEPTSPTIPSTQPTDPSQPTEPSTPIVPDSPQVETAEALINRYTWYMAQGLCCSFELDTRDLSAHLTDNQKQLYYNQQYRITCCHSPQEFQSHIDSTLSKDLQVWSDVTGRLFTDSEGQLYLINIPTGYVSYRNVSTAEANGCLYAKTGAYDEDGWFADAYFTIKDGIITQAARTDSGGIPIYAEGLTFPLHIGTIFDKPESWYRRALTSSYTDPKDANIARFFSQGFADEPAITDSEWTALKDIPGFARSENLHRLPAKRMDDVLTQVFGLTLSQMNGIGIEKLTYLESTGCYYLMEGEDNTLSELHFSQTPHAGNNQYINGNFESWAVYIVLTKEGPRIQQNSIGYTQQVLQTTQLAKDHLGMSRLEFLYASTLILQEKMKSEGWSQADMDSVYWNAHSIANRSLYLEDGILMMKAQYNSLAAPDDPLHQTVYLPYSSPTLPADLKAQSYLWLFKMEGQADGYAADAYAALLLDCAFAEPDNFLQYLAEFDEDIIRNCKELMYYGILSQEEADLFSKLLTALSSRDDLNGREQRTLEILTQVPDSFPYSISPAPKPTPQGNSSDTVTGQNPTLTNGLVTIPPANTLTHTHVYTDNTVAPTCVVKGYDLHLCSCGAYYCDDFKGIISHDYQLTYYGPGRTPTYEEPGFQTWECQFCADSYTVELPAGKDFDLEAVTARGMSYAQSLGFQTSFQQDENYYKAFSKTIELGFPEVYSSYCNGEEAMLQRLMKLIDTAARDSWAVPEKFVIEISISLAVYPNEYREFYITVTLYNT